MKIFLMVTCCFNYNRDNEARVAKKVNKLRTALTALIGLINVAASAVTFIECFLDDEILKTT
jgi:hypothetical protein